MTDEQKQVNTVMLAYYHPSGSQIKNPAGWLRRHGWVAFDGSVWLGHADMLPVLPVDEWRSKGGRESIVPFVEAQWPMVREMARIGLERRIAEIREALTEGIARANTKLAEAERLQSAKDVKKGVGLARDRVNTAKRHLLYAAEAALIFDLTGDMEELMKSVREFVSATADATMAECGQARDRSKAFPDYVAPKRKAKGPRKARARAAASAQAAADAAQEQHDVDAMEEAEAGEGAVAVDEDTALCPDCEGNDALCNTCGGVGRLTLEQAALIIEERANAEIEDEAEAVSSPDDGGIEGMLKFLAEVR